MKKPAKRKTAPKPARKKPVKPARRVAHGAVGGGGGGGAKPTRKKPVHRTGHGAVGGGGGAKPVKARAWSPDGDVALCSARAVAESLRLALGVTVSDDDVLGLHWAAGGDPDAGATILATLEAAQEHGLAGVQPASVEMVPPCAPAVRRLGRSALCLRGLTAYPGGGADCLILGVELPEGPHAVLEHGGAWWSWGEPYSRASFPGAVVEEAWALTWR